ncbi:cyclic pyranopterin monophosphate synthase MoaC [bacterium]|nr:cyclic pyranopterin monophosphate synthase MoaC [bacterium]
MSKLTHINEENQPQMVDISHKSPSLREATAEATVHLGGEIMQLIENNELVGPKGPVFQTAIISGTQAVKKTSELIPFCHPLLLNSIKVKIKTLNEEAVLVECNVKCEGKTGVEMEALTGASVAALCIYDMCKAMSHHIEISQTRLMEKTGGKSDFKRI